MSPRGSICLLSLVGEQQMAIAQVGGSRGPCEAFSLGLWRPRSLRFVMGAEAVPCGARGQGERRATGAAEMGFTVSLLSIDSIDIQSFSFEKRTDRGGGQKVIKVIGTGLVGGSLGHAPPSHLSASGPCPAGPAVLVSRPSHPADLGVL